MPSPHQSLDRSAWTPSDLRVSRTRALRGPNVWYPEPALLAELRLGGLAAVEAASAGAFLDALRAALPALDLASLDVAPPDPTRVHPKAAWWGTLLARVAAELARLAGAAPARGRVVLSAPHEDRLTVAVTFEEEELAIDAVRLAARVMRDALRGDDPGIDEIVDTLRRRHAATHPDPSSLLVIDAARRRGIAVRRSLDTPVIQLGLGATQRRVLGGATERTSVLAAGNVATQRRVRRVISGVGVPVPASERARSLEDALESAADIGFPVQLVSRRAAHSLHTSPPLADERALREAWGALGDDADVNVERAIGGETYRALVVGGRVIAVARLSGRGAGHLSDCTREAHEDVRTMCELAAGAVGLDVAGVDVRTPDITAPLRKGGGVVSAVHASPDLTLHAGAAEDVGDAIVGMLYPPGAPTTIPVVAITGTNGKTTTTRLIAHLFRQTGRTVGFTTTDGVYLREQLLMSGDLTGPFAASVILSHREVEVAVLETARGGILKSGLGFERCDVAVVMNVTPDHLGLGGIETVEQLADVKGVLPSVVSPGGVAVLNADDPLVYAMRLRTRGAVALFSTQPAGSNPAVEAHREGGGVVACLEVIDGRERLVVLDGERRTELGYAGEVPLTFGGLARFQVQNVLAASLAAYVQGVTAEEIRAGLASFLPSSGTTPGRLNVVETPRGRVLIDYAHNAAALAGLVSFVRAMPARRRMALLSAPGDRRDADLREIGSLAAGLDLVIMKEHEVYRRGRAPGAIAALMAEGLRDVGFPEERIRTFVEEHEAVTHVMSVMEPGDVVIIIADDTHAVREQLVQMG